MAKQEDFRQIEKNTDEIVSVKILMLTMHLTLLLYLKHWKFEHFFLSILSKSRNLFWLPLQTVKAEEILKKS